MVCPDQQIEDAHLAELATPPEPAPEGRKGRSVAVDVDLVAADEGERALAERRLRWREVTAAAAAQGAVYGGVKALIDRAGATGFARLTGSWPGPSKT